ncbi:hypothetical protein BU17DRAFT_97600 [Hysterangium stoloniferum]|nr:hypothetical protein BU17DRAFT_97600 [Hysterangium stoloniferum]
MFHFVCLYVLLTAVLSTAAPVSTTTSRWFTVEWNGVEFTQMSGKFVVPNLPQEDGAAFLWPGLQGPNGALQAQLTGSSGALSLQNIFYGDSILSSGEPLTVSPGDVVQFSFNRIAFGIWSATFTRGDEENTRLHVWGATMNRAIFAIQLNNAPHDFEVQFSDLVITAASSPAITWCEKVASNGFENYTVKGAVAAGTSCHIEQLILPATA